ncbi:MAG: carbohydrate kinase [Rikenellaceae bacterium]
MEKGYLVGIGELLWDVLPDGKKLGGAPGNFAYHASQFGFKTAVASAIGNDKLGEEMTREIESKGINGVIERVAYPTGSVQVTLDDEGIPQYEIKENVAWDNIPFTSRLEELAKQTQAVIFGSLAQRNIVSRETIYKFLDTMPKEEGRYRIFDINLRQGFYTKRTIELSLEQCNILKINDEELVAVSRLFGLQGTDLQEKCMQLLKQYSLEMLILTCGVNGSYVFTADSSSFAATPKVDVADTVGAGDSFTATFISAILSGTPIVEAHQKAVRVSAYVCTQHGAMPVIPENLR